MLAPGDPAPTFSLPADDGSTVSLSDFAGRRVLVYFYPKDDTPGCTTQACDLRDGMPDFEALGVEVVGISPDSVESHVKFRDKHGLNFRLLSDEDRSVAEAYGVWKERSMYGRRFMGIERSSFLIDAEGRIEQVWRKVKASKHADMVREHLEAAA